MNEAPTVETPAIPSNSDDAVAARFRESMSGHKDSVHFEKKEPEPEKTEKVESGIPDEFLSDKKSEDEYDTLIKEEPKGPVKHENYKKFQAAADKKVQALLKELEETKGKLPKDDYVPEKVSKQLEDLSKRLQEKEDLISRKYVEESPAFKEKFIQRKESIVNRLNKAAKDFELSDRVVKSLLATDSLKERAEILDDAGLGTAGASTVSTILNDYDSVESERSDYLNNWRTHKVELEEQEQKLRDEDTVLRGKYLEKAFDEVRDSMAEKYSILSKIPGNNEWNSLVEKDFTTAKENLFKKLTDHEVSEMSIAAQASTRMAKMLEDMIGKYKVMARELEEVKAANPSMNPGGKDPKADPTKNMTADERAAWTFNQLRGTAR